MPRAIPAILSRWTIPFCVLFALPALCGSAAGEPMVHKIAETFDEAAWPPDGWNRAAGTTALVSEASPGAAPGKCLEMKVQFSGKGFEWFAAVAPEPLTIPGDVRSVRLRYKLDDKRYPLVVNFRDGWGRTQAGPKKLEWGLPESAAEGRWATATFPVPADWVRPVSVVGFGTHNWSAQSEAKTVRFWVDQIEVETDIGDVDPETGLLKTWKPDPQPKGPKTAPTQSPRTPLVQIRYSTGQVSNLFSGQEPAIMVGLRNWRPAPLRGTLTVEVRDDAGRLADRQERPVEVEAAAAVRLPVKAGRFGLYTAAAELVLADGAKRTGKMTFAKLPVARDLSPEEKRASPYGINVNGGRQNFAVEPFRRAGIVWFRDYAFSYEWLLRAKGDDRRYAGWPSYPAILQRYRQAGAMVLPCLMKSIRPPEAGKSGSPARLGPDRTWTAQIADIVGSFPEMTHWELDNEYDLAKDHADAESAVGWRNYLAYHRKLAEIVGLLGGGEVVTVEQGAAGIYPDRICQSVQSGDFEKVGVVNSHYYCGTEAPEVNAGNWNMDAAGDFRRQPPMLFFDRLRAAKEAACCDGRTRESWLTEFGWDTLAGPRVSPYQQAAYLARGWLLALAAGTDKCFWFFDYDAPEPKQFFDGCGLLAADGSPKLSLCAMAGLASALPAPRYVGSVDAGRGTCGFVFTCRGELVAAVWSIHEESGPSITFRARELRDYLGNRLDGLTARLSLAPVYAVGLSTEDALYRQTAYALSTPHLAAATAGDAVTPVLEIRNNRPDPIDCTVRLIPPEGWNAQTPEAAVRVAKGESRKVQLALVVPPNEPAGAKEATLAIDEREAVKQIPIKVLVQPALTLDVGPLRGAPGPSTVVVKVGNRSTRPLDGTLRLRLPKSWQAQTPEIAVEGLKPEEVRQIDCRLTWDADWQADETASVTFDGGGGRTIAASIVPARFRLPLAKGITLDGREDDWPAGSQLPGWMLRPAQGQSPARIRLAWGPGGLYGLVEVHEAELENPDPRSFWTCNCLELFVDCRDDKHDRSFVPGDHQFWLVPLIAEKRVYVGQWKRGGEIAETRYDLRGVEGVAVAKGRGYVMEFRIPAAELHGYEPAAGRSLGINVNLTIQSKQGPREVYWPTAKNAGVLTRPSTWGSTELGK